MAGKLYILVRSACVVLIVGWGHAELLGSWKCTEEEGCVMEGHSKEPL